MGMQMDMPMAMAAVPKLLGKWFWDSTSAYEHGAA